MKPYILLYYKGGGYILKEVLDSFDVGELAEKFPDNIYLYVDSTERAIYHHSS